MDKEKLISAKELAIKMNVTKSTITNWIKDGCPYETKLPLRFYWSKVKDFRNIIAHNYFGIDAEEVWQIIKNDLPKLKDDINKILN